MSTLIEKFKNMIGLGSRDRNEDMFKIQLIEKVNESHTIVSEIRDRLKDDESRRVIRVDEIPLSSDNIDYEQLEDRYRENFKQKFLRINNHILNDIPAMIYKYDELLYCNRSSISVSELSSRMMSLNMLREYILLELFGEHNDYNFFLGYTDTNLFHRTASSIELIDISKLLTDKAIMANSLYLIIEMYNDDIHILTNDGRQIDIDPRKRNTLLRVLYSLYMDRFYLYHLVKTKNELRGE